MRGREALSCFVSAEDNVAVRLVFPFTRTIVVSFHSILETSGIAFIYDRYPLERVPEALEALGSRRTYGKVIVAP